jgi:hypothetical protein
LVFKAAQYESRSIPSFWQQIDRLNKAEPNSQGKWRGEAPAKCAATEQKRAGGTAKGVAFRGETHRSLAGPGGSCPVAESQEELEGKS